MTIGEIKDLPATIYKMPFVLYCEGFLNGCAATLVCRFSVMTYTISLYIV